MALMSAVLLFFNGNEAIHKQLPLFVCKFMQMLIVPS